LTATTVAEAEPDDGDRRTRATQSVALDAIAAMLALLDEDALTEIERALVLTLRPADSPTARRVAELGFLAELLSRTPRERGFKISYAAREDHDRLRPPDAPASARLVERYGSWRAACWHAYGQLPDGRWLGPSRPWPSALRGQARIRPYTREEVLASIRHCARELRRRPTHTDYERWLRAKRRRALLTGKMIRLAGHSAIYRHFPASTGGWNAALKEALQPQVPIMKIAQRPARLTGEAQ
jgi:hypothetical protein